MLRNASNAHMDKYLIVLQENVSYVFLIIHALKLAMLNSFMTLKLLQVVVVIITILLPPVLDLSSVSLVSLVSLY